ncbi:conserved hypothetical protein [Culex quinquefasciatus]|uniref:40S ribosomal protein S14 n=1 Tax=Culex quinquefasciatus TaxID=7176 RepID=B0WWC6_CULQU|nr:conserved hypothetical protein [Culex quinquefasciatus]|eukprot:XP_001861698.1 conserved hypothetical protein [Culex quinquefasciatus]
MGATTAEAGGPAGAAAGARAAAGAAGAASAAGAAGATGAEQRQQEHGSGNSRKNRLEEVQVLLGRDRVRSGIRLRQLQRYLHPRYGSFGQVTIWRSTGAALRSRLIMTRLALRCYVAALYVGGKCKSLGITALHMKLRAAGENCTKTAGPGAQSVLRALARSSMNIVKIDNIL